MMAFFDCFFEMEKLFTEAGECFEAEHCKTTILKDGISDGLQS